MKTQLTTAERVAARLEKVHPNAKTKVRLTAQYVSHGLKEYYLEIAPNGLWRIVQFSGGVLPKSLHGFFTSEHEAHNILVRYLKYRDRRGNAIWPGQ